MLIGFVLSAGFLLLSYSSVMSHYLWDEDDFVYVSKAVDESSPAYIFESESYIQAFPRPVTHLYFWIIALFSGTVIWPYYLTNLLLYAAGSVLLFRLVFKLSGNLLTGMLAGVFYLVCPCATDNLYWMAAGSTGFLAGFFMLLTALIYLKARDTTGCKLWILACLTAILATGAKESALSLPLLLTLLEFADGKKRSGWWKRLLPFYVITLLFAVNVIAVQLSFTNEANFSRYGLNWMIPRNLLHFVLFPLVGIMPPNTGEYNLFKMIFYPILWSLPFFLGSAESKRLVRFGLAWIVLSSLPFLAWYMNLEGFFPRICDIASRYFNIPSMGAAMIAGGFIMMLHERTGRKITIGAIVLTITVMAVTGVKWTHEKVQEVISIAETSRNITDLALFSWNGSDTLYVGSFGFRDVRIESYNRMYFEGKLVQCDTYPENVQAGTRILMGPKTSPRLYEYDGNGWRILQSFLSCERTVETDQDSSRSR